MLEEGIHEELPKQVGVRFTEVTAGIIKPCRTKRQERAIQIGHSTHEGME